jgi:hypothetical protein
MEKVIKICAGCGSEFVLGKYKEKRYCTQKCWVKVLHASGQVPYAKNSRGKPIHGYAANGRTPEYCTWQRIKRRCKRHPHYVKNNITVWHGWHDDPVAFIEYVLANLGRYPGKGWSIDRIDGTRGYEPGNIRWATIIEQRHNQARWIERHHTSE